MFSCRLPEAIHVVHEDGKGSTELCTSFYILKNWLFKPVLVLTRFRKGLQLEVLGTSCQGSFPRVKMAAFLNQMGVILPRIGIYEITDQGMREFISRY